jgi:hypothetical protein
MGVKMFDQKEYKKKYHCTKNGHLRRNLDNIKTRAKQKNLDFNLDVEYLFNIPSDNCPIFDFKLSWGESKNKATFNSPSLDRIDPTKGYIKGNVQWVSHLANTMKNNASKEQLVLFANWILKTYE